MTGGGKARSQQPGYTQKQGQLVKAFFRHSKRGASFPLWKMEEGERLPSSLEGLHAVCALMYKMCTSTSVWPHAHAQVHTDTHPGLSGRVCIGPAVGCRPFSQRFIKPRRAALQQSFCLILGRKRRRRQPRLGLSSRDTCAPSPVSCPYRQHHQSCHRADLA